MKKRGFIDLVNAYADGLVAGNLTAGDYLSYTAQPDDVTELLRLTDDIAGLLVPINPSPKFIQQLGIALAAAAAPAEIIIAQPSRKRIWLGALLSGSLVSAIGVLALWWMKRSRRGAAVAG